MGGTVACKMPWERLGKVEDWVGKPHMAKKENETQLKLGCRCLPHVFIWEVTLLYNRAHLLSRTAT